MKKLLPITVVAAAFIVFAMWITGVFKGCKKAAPPASQTAIKFEPGNYVISADPDSLITPVKPSPAPRPAKVARVRPSSGGWISGGTAWVVDTAQVVPDIYFVYDESGNLYSTTESPRVLSAADSAALEICNVRGHVNFGRGLVYQQPADVLCSRHLVDGPDSSFVVRPACRFFNYICERCGQRIYDREKEEKTQIYPPNHNEANDH